MTKVCFFVPSLDIGGIEGVFITYANELSRREYEVSFLLCYRKGALLPLVSDDVKIADLKNVQLRFSFFKLRKYIKKARPDVLITGGDIPNMICVLATRLMRRRPKIILSKHNYRNVETKELGWWSRFDLVLQKKIYPLADKIIAVSKGIERYLKDDLHIGSNKVVHICNPIDIGDIIKKGNESIGVDLPENYIVFVGRLGKVKNLSLLFKSFDRLSNEKMHLVIVGDGSEREYLEHFATSLASNNKIHFVGSVSNPMPIIRKASALALCSFSEAYPTILLEAMTFDVPIVATPTEGAKEILKDVKGAYLASSFDNVDEFSGLLELAVQSGSPSLKDYVHQNEKEHIVDKMENVINKCLDYECN